MWFHLYEIPRIIKFIETERRIVVARSSWGEGGKESYLMDQVSVWDNEKVLEVIVVKHAQYKYT